MTKREYITVRRPIHHKGINLKFTVVSYQLSVSTVNELITDS